ncbi:MAG: polyprenyl synthetase family protein [Candidatus Thermoplasmatota archaeon]|nr:polyprenyl synthetase family protein [Candidatus Thermoplasmatota archaeon]
MNSDHHAILRSMKERVDKELVAYFNSTTGLVSDPVCKMVYRHIMEFTMNGGKRLRPILVVLGHDLFAPPDERVYRAAISIELTQTYLLIHDDIMDQSEVRRGKPSLHVAVRHDIHGQTQDARRISENIAIIAGDLADSYAHQALLTCGLPPQETMEANLELSRIIEMTGYGQLIDINSSYNENFSQSDLLRLHLLKTAKYTIEGPLKMGALLSGTKQNILPLSYYGTLLGTAFQLHDDILGLFGEEEKTGKSIKSDVNEGKKTLLMLKAMDLASPEDADFIRKSLKSGNVSDSDFKRIQDIVMKSGSYDYSRKLMTQMIQKSREYLEQVNGESNVKGFLSWLASYIIERSN